MSNKISAISDVHGEYNKLTVIFNKLQKKGVRFEEDTVVVLGDIIDGGPDARLVVDALMYFQSLYPNFVVLMGNHEAMMLKAMNSEPDSQDWNLWWHQGGRETAFSYFPPNISSYDRAISNPRQFIDPAHLAWMANLPLSYESESFIFVHAGMRPGFDLDHQDPRDLLWIREPFFESDYIWEKRVIAGHTYHPEPIVKPGLISMDTMHHGYGEITAAILDDSTGDIIEFVSSHA